MSDSTPLLGGIIAAGRGDRLRTASATPKPLVQVAGRPLIEHVLHSMAAAGTSEIVVIINEESLAIRDYVSRSAWPFVIRWIVETTPSSMHSFLRVVETLTERDPAGPYLISTVDTIAPAAAYAQFAADAMRDGRAVAALALTSVIDDEKPLLVRIEGTKVMAIGDDAADSRYATAGYYVVAPAILREADAARRDGLTALRVFLKRLLDRGYPMIGIPVPPSIDVDRPLDVDAAEAFLKRVTA